MATMPGTLALSALLAFLGPPSAVPSASCRHGFPSGRALPPQIIARNISARAVHSPRPLAMLELYALPSGHPDPQGSNAFLASENRSEHCSDPRAIAHGHCAPAARSRADQSAFPLGALRTLYELQFQDMDPGGSMAYFDPLNTVEHLSRLIETTRARCGLILAELSLPDPPEHGLSPLVNLSGLEYHRAKGWGDLDVAYQGRPVAPTRHVPPFGAGPLLAGSFAPPAFRFRLAVCTPLMLHEFYGWLLLVRGEQPPVSRSYRRVLAHRRRRSHTVVLRYHTPLCPYIAHRRRLDVREYIRHYRLPRLERQTLRALRRQNFVATQSVGMPVFCPPVARPIITQIGVALWSPCTTAALHALRLYAWVHVAIGSLWSSLEPIALTALLSVSGLLRRLVDHVAGQETYADAHRAAWHMLFELEASRPLQRRWRRLNVARRAYASSTMDNLLVYTALIGCVCLRVSGWCIRQLMQDSRVTDIPESIVVAHARLLIRREAHAACAGRHILLCVTTMMCTLRDATAFMLNSRLAVSTVSLVLLPLATGSDDMVSSSRPPSFDGTRTAFLAWLMAFSGYVSWKLTDCVDLMDDDPTTEPAVPELVATTDEVEGNEEEVEAAIEQRDDWRKRNRRLYGLLMQAVPDWLRTSLYNQHRNDGVASLGHLRRSFDVIDANDHAACIARLQTSYVDPKNDIREEDLRAQFDGMQVATAGIVRSGHTAPPDATVH